MNLTFDQISRISEQLPQRNIAFKLFNRFRYLLRNRWFASHGSRFWSDVKLLKYEDLHKKIVLAILDREPLAVGRLGGVEASLVMWSRGIPEKFCAKTLFGDTSHGSTNAGIRPRNKESYHAFATIAWKAAEHLDLQAVWKTGYEAECIKRLTARGLFDGETAAPDGTYLQHWTSALKGRRVMVVSPFVETIERQLLRIKLVWPNLDWFEGTQFELLRFPYLIEEGCVESWWDVYERIGKTISGGNYDVALFGCGGLGLPFTMLAKHSGRVGIQLGGHLQLLFGIYGQRHLDHEWHRKHINDSWVRPSRDEVPSSAQRVEGGCYW